MKKPALAIAAASALISAALALAAPAAALPGGPAPQDCGVHVLYNGADVNVNWC
jgi:hypothetical protein